MSFFIGILLIIAGIAVFIFGFNCDEYTTFTELTDGSFWESPGYGTWVLMGVAVLVIIVELVLKKVFGVAQDYSFLIYWFGAAGIAAKMGFVAVPLVAESGIFVLVGLAQVLTEAQFDKLSSFLSSPVGAGGLIILTLVVAFRIHSNMV